LATIVVIIPEGASELTTECFFKFTAEGAEIAEGCISKLLKGIDKIELVLI